MRPQSRQQRIAKGIRFLSCRDLAGVALNDDGVFVRILPESAVAVEDGLRIPPGKRCLESNVQWNTLNPKWPVGENALPSYFVLQVVRVSRAREEPPLREEDLVADLASSTLSRPRYIDDVYDVRNGASPSWKSRFEKSTTILLTYRFTRLNENSETDALVPIGLLTSKDLPRIRRFPLNCVIFEMVPGNRLVSTAAAASFIMKFGLGATTISSALTTLGNHQEPEFQTFVALFGHKKMNQIVKAAERVQDAQRGFSARAKVAEANMRERARVEKVREERRVRAARVEKLRRDRETLSRRVEEMRNQVGFARREATTRIQKLVMDSESRPSHPASLTSREGPELELASEVRARRVFLQARRMRLVERLVRIFPISTHAVRGLNLFAQGTSTSEDDAYARDCAAGSLAHLLSLLAGVLEISLRYTLYPNGSRSVVVDPLVVVGGGTYGWRTAGVLEALVASAALTSTSPVTVTSPLGANSNSSSSRSPQFLGISPSAMASGHGIYPLFTSELDRVTISGKYRLGRGMLFATVLQICEALRSAFPWVDDVPLVGVNTTNDVVHHRRARLEEEEGGLFASNGTGELNLHASEEAHKAVMHEFVGLLKRLGVYSYDV